MLNTVREAFDQFRQSIELTERQRQDAKTKHAGVRERLSSSFSVMTTLLSGSYARSTMVRPPSDIDLMVVLDYEKHGPEYLNHPFGATFALTALQQALERSYPDTPIRKEHPSVNLDFTTYGFDVVPAFARANGGYMIPRRTGMGWMPTDPTQHAGLTTAMNEATEDTFVPLVKMLKAWNREHGSVLRGFHLEVALAAAWPRAAERPGTRASPLVRWGSFSQATAGLLPRLAAVVGRPGLEDPAGLSGAIDDYLMILKRLQVQRLLSDAAQVAQRALAAANQGQTAKALLLWKTIFGQNFPVQG